MVQAEGKHSCRARGRDERTESSWEPGELANVNRGTLTMRRLQVKAARTGLRGRHRNLPHSGRWYSARHSRRKPLCLSRLLALEGAKTRTIGLLIEKLLHALRAAVFLVDETDRKSTRLNSSHLG